MPVPELIALCLSALAAVGSMAALGVSARRSAMVRFTRELDEIRSEAQVWKTAAVRMRKEVEAVCDQVEMKRRSIASHVSRANAKDEQAAAGSNGQEVDPDDPVERRRLMREGHL